MANRASQRGVVLLAALVFIAVLAVMVTAQIERLPFVSSEGRAAAKIVQRQLDASSALQFAIGILKADAATNDFDSFADSWTKPHRVSLGETDIEVRIADSVFLRVPEDEWIRQDLGIPDDVCIVATEDLHVHDLFVRMKPNINTAPLRALRRAGGLSAEAIAWVKKRRQQQALTRSEDLSGAPGFSLEDYRRNLASVAFASGLFVADATIRREGESPQRCYWVLRREGKAIRVVYSGYGYLVR